MDYTIINHHFPGLSPKQQAQFAALAPQYELWNARINVVSRKDIESLYLHHVLHSLAIAKVISFASGARILDVGTGGGFPGIPLAIFFPQTQFVLCDSIAKKIRVVQEVARALELSNVIALQVRAEQIPETFDFVVSRAVTRLAEFVPWVWNKITPAPAQERPHGILYLKGGYLAEEITDCVRLNKIPRNSICELAVSDWFDDPFFQEKKIVYLQKQNLFAQKN